MAAAIRNNKRVQLLPSFKAEVAQLLGRSEETINVTDLEQYDEALKLFWSRRSNVMEEPQKAGHYSLRTADAAVFKCVMGEVASKFPEADMLLFRETGKECGAVFTTGPEIFSRMFELFGLEGEDLMACSIDGGCGVYCAWWEWRTPQSVTEVFEFQAWIPHPMGRKQMP
jgi:hypothetical protein